MSCLRTTNSTNSTIFCTFCAQTKRFQCFVQIAIMILKQTHRRNVFAIANFGDVMSHNFWCSFLGLKIETNLTTTNKNSTNASTFQTDATLRIITKRWPNDNSVQNIERVQTSQNLDDNNSCKISNWIKLY